MQQVSSDEYSYTFVCKVPRYGKNIPALLIAHGGERIGSCRHSKSGKSLKNYRVTNFPGASHTSKSEKNNWIDKM